MRSSTSLLFLIVQFLHIARFIDMRQVNLCLDFVCVACGERAFGGRRSSCLGCTEVGAHLFRLVFLQRAGMGFLLGDSYFGQYIENGLALDFELPGQIIDSNLTHQPFPCSAPLLKSS